MPTRTCTSPIRRRPNHLLRRSVATLGAALPDRGLHEALTELAQRSSSPTTQVEFCEHGEGREIPAQLRASLFRVAQEGLNNGLRHAQTDRITMELHRGGDQVELSIWDHSCGNHNPHEGHGLAGMRRRIEEHGGTLRLANRCGSGFSLSAEIPYG